MAKSFVSQCHQTTRCENIKQLNGGREKICSSIFRIGWRTSVAIGGFYLLALTCAVLHHTVFIYFNKRVLDVGPKAYPFKSTAVSQSHVTTISLVLVTAFRAALIASVGISYTQYLWKRLRLSLFPVGLIEELFQIRNNPLRLLNYTLLRASPTLAAVAMFSWLVPIAMIYPPGTLVVNLESRSFPEKFNVSVLQPDGNNSLSASAATTYLEPPAATEAPSIRRRSDRVGPCPYCTYTVKSSLYDLASSTLISSNLVDLRSAPGRDILYSLEFQGPTLICHETIGMDLKAYHQTDIKGVEDDPTQSSYIELKDPIQPYYLTWNPGGLSLRMISDLESMKQSPCIRRRVIESGDSATGLQDGNLIFPVRTLECSAATTRYKVNIASINGAQNVTYSMATAHKLEEINSTSESPNISPLRSLDEYRKTLALLEAFLSNFYFEDLDVTTVPLDSDPNRPTATETFNLFNGSAVTMEVCPVYGNTQIGVSTQYRNGNPFLALSSYNKLRASKVLQDPVNDLIITEALLNEGLANVTISALSLNTWMDIVDGMETKQFNVYSFENRLAFFLPYGVCLLLTIPIIVIGLKAQSDNGVSAIDGGFLQILVSTTGRTELEKCATKGCLGGYESIPEELKQLKVRFGELLSDEDMSRGRPSSSHSPAQESRASQISNASRNSMSDRTERLTEEQDGASLGQCEVSRARGQIEAEQDSNSARQSEGSSHITMASAVQIQTPAPRISRRVGFGTRDETKPL